MNPGYEGLLGNGRVNLTRALGDSRQLVPQEFAAIGDALNCASTGDEIRILASHQLPRFAVIDRDLQVLGGYDAGYETRDPLGNPTVVQADGANPALEFFGPVTTSTVVDGFVLQGGGGRTFSDIPYPGRYGGGLLISSQSPTLRNLTITGNCVGSSSQLGGGGGILLHNSQAVLEDIVVTGNNATLGCGIYIYQGAPSLTRVTVDANTLIIDDFANLPKGGGMHILDADVTLNDVTVTNHLDADQGGGIYLAQVNGPASLTMTGGEVSGNTAKSFGGGIHAAGTGGIDLMDVAIMDNGPTAAATFMAGGALYATGVTVNLDGLTVTGNSAQSGGGIQVASSPDIVAANTVLTGNQSLIFGGTVYLTGAASASFTGLTIADNSSVSGGAGLNAQSSNVSVSNTISAFNTGGAGTANGINATAATATLSCNDVFGNDGANYGGVADPTGTDGNVSLDPMFCNAPGGDYRVSPDGPCAPDQSGGCGLIGALEATCGGTVGVDDPELPLAFSVEPNFPNPFNPVTTIRFAIPTAARTTVTVFDLRGRRVKTLVDTELAPAVHSVQWRGDDTDGRPAAAGIYFYEVLSGDHRGRRAHGADQVAAPGRRHGPDRRFAILLEGPCPGTAPEARPHPGRSSSPWREKAVDPADRPLFDQWSAARMGDISHRRAPWWYSIR